METIKTKRIKTNKERNLKRLDIVFILGCIIYVIFQNNFAIIKYLTDAFKVCEGNLYHFSLIFLLWIWMFVMQIITKCFIFIAIYLGYRKVRMKNIRKNSKYQVIDNIDYYRNKFNNITPSEISLITDLEIETKKDITATILKLYQNGIVEFNEQNILINDYKINNSLKQSELKIIEMLKYNNFGITNISTWKDICIEEAIKDNYIKEKGEKEKGPKFIVTVVLVILAIITMFIVAIELGSWLTSWMDNNQELLYKITNIDASQTGAKTDMEYLLTHPEDKELFFGLLKAIVPLFTFCSIFLISLYSIVFIPIYRFIKRLTHKAIEVKNKYERTNESKILVEQIAGIKNYIHEFSLLNEKEKEHIVLWEDFLIYAVLLEENEEIVKDIFKYRNMNFDINSYIASILNI